MSEKFKIDLIRNKIQENNYQSVTFNFALHEEDNLWKIIVARIIFEETPKKENKTLFKGDQFALENFSFSIPEFNNFLDYLERVFVGDVFKKESTFEINDKLFFQFGDYKICFVGNFPANEFYFYGRDITKKHHGIDKPVYHFSYALHQLVTSRSYDRLSFSSYEIPLRDVTEAINHFWKTNYQHHSFSHECQFYFPNYQGSIVKCDVLAKHITITCEWNEEKIDVDNLALSIIASNETNEFREKIPLKKKSLTVELGFVPSNASFYLIMNKLKLDEYNYYKPRENEEDNYDFREQKQRKVNFGKKKIVLFTGAGASIQFDIPATKEFKEYLLKNDSTGVQLFPILLNQPDFPDIEHVLQCLEQIKDVRNNHAGMFLGKQDNKITVNASPQISVQEVFGQADGLYNHILQTLFQKYQIQSQFNEELVKFYDELFEIISKQGERVDIGTTNYDLAIETCCNLQPEKFTCIDGFKMAGTRQIWKPEKFEELSKKTSDMPILLYKIHGSLNWVNESGITKTEKIDYDQGKSVIIAPTLSPKNASENEPYKTILDKFVNQLQNADVCVTIGTSFRDKVISKHFVEFLENGKHLIIISPSCYQSYARELCGQRDMPDLKCVEWSKFYSMEKNGKVTFINLPANKENNPEIFNRLRKALNKN